MRPRISIREPVRRSVGPSVAWSVARSVAPWYLSFNLFFIFTLNLHLHLHLHLHLCSETGWTYDYVRCLTIKTLETPLNGVLAFGRRKKTFPFCPSLASVFRFNVRDINSIASLEKNLCVPASCILKLLAEQGTALTSVSGATIKKCLNYINFRSLLSFEGQGITIENFSQLERLNSPFHKSLILIFPLLRKFQSLSINLFKIHHNKAHNQYSIHPIHLSKHHKKQDHMQIDLLIDDPTIRLQQHKTNGNHVLTILNLPRLLASFMSAHNRHTNRFQHCCRQCMRVFSDYNEFTQHIAHCKVFTSGCAAKRKTHNTFIHRTKIYIKSLNKYIPNVLQFNRKNLAKMLSPISFLALDLEATNQKHEGDGLYSSIPRSGIVLEQKVLAAAFIVKTLVSQFPLPDCIAQPKTLFFDESITSKESFWLRFFQMLRATIQEVFAYELDVLKKTRYIPRLKDLSITERIRFIASKSCEFCLVKFGSFRKAANGIKYRVLKNLDHCHLQAKPQEEGKSVLRFILCSQCNLALAQRPVSVKTSRIIYIHNASKYINLIALLLLPIYHPINQFTTKLKSSFFYQYITIFHSSITGLFL